MRDLPKTVVLGAIIVALAMVTAACASGPSSEALARNERPATTTTTEPPPEGVFVVKIRNAAFRPSNLTIDLDEFQIIRWENEDDQTYQIMSRERGDDGQRVFESPELSLGSTWEFDFTSLEPAVHRYFMTLGAQSIPGLVDTRPAQ